jgi:hypothetical protein
MASRASPMSDLPVLPDDRRTIRQTPLEGSETILEADPRLDKFDGALWKLVQARQVRWRDRTSPTNTSRSR